MKYYTIPEAAELLHCSVTTVRRRIYAGELKPQKNGNVYLISQETINDLIGVNEKTDTSLSTKEKLETIIQFLESENLELERKLDKTATIERLFDNEKLLELTRFYAENGKPPFDYSNIIRYFREALEQRNFEIGMLSNTNAILLRYAEGLLELTKEVETIKSNPDKKG